MKAPPITNASVLYAEDDENDLFFMRRAFQQEGLDHLLRTVSNGREAIGYLAGHGAFADRGRYPLPAVVLLDLNLPLVAGFAVLEWLRERPEFRDLTVVVFSSSSREEDRVKASELAADEFLEKPRSAILFRQVVQALREKWLPD